jgi:hypothetical protein
MKTVVQSILAVAAFVAALGFDIPPSQAYYGNAPWCAVVSIGSGSVIWDCQYYTFEECVPNVLAGNRGTCNLSPWYTPKTIATKKHRARRAQRNE